MQTLFWDQLSVSDKKKLAQQRPILILGSRDISKARIKQLLQEIATHVGSKERSDQNSKKKHSLNSDQSLIWGCLENEYIPGLEKSPQFKSLSLKKLASVLADFEAGSASSSKNSTAGTGLSILNYRFQYSHYLIKELKPAAVIAVYGSWHRAFHYTPIYFEINRQRINYKLVSGFVNTREAKKYWKDISKKLPDLSSKKLNKNDKKYSDEQLLAIAQQASRCSCDYTHQVGAALAKDGRFVLAAHNRVVPYPTYTLHHGATKEKQLAPPHDLNNFDTNHAEVELVLKAAQKKIDLSNTSLYINLLPCPICARMIARSPINRIVYQHDHSKGYGYKLLTASGKQVERIE